jgi:hypothetical protein
MALAKSMRSKITHRYQNGRYRPVSTHYLDSQVCTYLATHVLHLESSPATTLSDEQWPQMLLLEMQHSADVLAQGLLDRNSITYKSFFSSSVPSEYLTVSSTGDQAFKRSASAAKTVKMSDGRTGTRILPVYIFSLDHMNHEMALEDFTKVQAYPNAVLILQTLQRQLDVPFFADDSIHVVDMLSMQKEILAGLAMAIGGVMPPYYRFTAQHNTTQPNYLWATGYDAWRTLRCVAAGSHRLTTAAATPPVIIHLVYLPVRLVLATFSSHQSSATLRCSISIMRFILLAMQFCRLMAFHKYVPQAIKIVL